jgi:hypothetical protein
VVDDHCYTPLYQIFHWLPCHAGTRAAGTGENYQFKRLKPLATAGILSGLLGTKPGAGSKVNLPENLFSKSQVIQGYYSLFD